MMETRRIIAYEYLLCLPTLVRFLVFFPSFELDDYFAVADVWGWVKYYREPHELTAAKQNNKIKPTAKPASNRRPNEGQKMEKTGGLFEKKYLLENDTQLTMLSKQNMTLRKALALLNESVALGLLVENWSAYPLGKVSSGGKMQFLYLGLYLKPNISWRKHSAKKSVVLLDTYMISNFQVPEEVV